MSLPPTPASLAAPTQLPTCRVSFGAPAASTGPAAAPLLSVSLPVLAGAADETILADTESIATREGFVVFNSEDRQRLGGFAVAPVGVDVEAAAADLYKRLFAVTSGRHLYRIWNYIPQINAITEDLEIYRRFCRGRSLAFERQFGGKFEQQLPAASGVGTAQGPLAVAFLAGEAPPTHFENPRQVPAFHYPAEYGPRAPSFSRATAIELRGRRRVFISGTAAIRGHATIATGNLPGQLDCTIDNLQTIAATAGIGASLGDSQAQRHFKVYLRRPADLRRVQAHLMGSLLRDDDHVSYLRADLCRADLLVEIEAVITTARPLRTD
jgi:hypothetical protein